VKLEILKEGRDELAHRARELLAPFSHRRTFDPGDLIFHEGDDDGMLSRASRAGSALDRRPC
jgi:hypothetical protein